jgi:TP901 family phage tail tape measure protein
MPVMMGSAFGKMILDASGVLSGSRRAKKEVLGLSGTLNRVGDQLTSVGKGLTTRLSLPLLGVGAAAAKTAGDFGASMAVLEVSASSSGEAIDDLRKVAIKAGSDTELLGVDAAEAAEAMTNFYKAGLDTNDILGDMEGYLADTTEVAGAFRASVDLAAASDLELAGSSDAVAIAMATYGIEAEDATDITDSFVKAADASVAEVSELVDAMRNIGPTAAAFGWSLEQTNTALAILSERGIKGSEAGTALKSMMTNMMRQTDDVIEMWKELDVALYNADGTMRELPDILADLERALAGATEEQRNNTVQTLAGTYGMKALNTLLAEGAGGWSEMERKIAAAASAQEIAKKRMDTFKGSVEALQGQLQTLLIQVGQPLVDEFLRPMAEGITETIAKINELNPEIFTWAVRLGAVAAAAGPVLLISGQLAFSLSSLVNTVGLISGGLAALPGILNTASAGFALLAEGESLAAVASLGLQAALFPIIAIVAAITAVVAAGVVGWKTYQQAQERTAEVTDTWTKLLQDQVAEGKNATEIADEYAAAQERVNEEYKKAPWYAKLFINKQKIMTGDAQTLSDTLLEASSSYEEYYAAAKRAGLITEDTAGYVYYAQEALREQEYAARRSAEAYGDASREIEQYGYTLQKSTDSMGEWRGAMDEHYQAATYGAGQWANSVAQATQEAAVAYSNLEVSASDFFRGVADMEEKHRADREKAILSHDDTLASIEEEYQAKVTDILQDGEDARRWALQAGSETTLRELELRLIDARDRYAKYNEDTSELTRFRTEQQIAELEEQIARERYLLDNRNVLATSSYANATEEQLAEAERLKNEAIALENERYQEELRIQAEQQAAEREQAKRHLGELLLQRVQYWVEAGNLTAGEGAALTNSIMEQYGIVESESLEKWKSATKAIDDYATGVTESLPLVETQLGLQAEGIDKLGQADTVLEEARRAFTDYGLQVPADLQRTRQASDETSAAFDRNLLAVQSLLETTGTKTRGLEQTSRSGFGGAGLALTEFSDGAEGDLITVRDLVGDVGQAIIGLPEHKMITIEARYIAPEELLLQSPTFAFQHALESAVQFAESNPIQVTAGIQPLPAADAIIRAPPTPAIQPAVSAIRSAAPSPAAPVQIPEGLVQANVHNDVDVEVLAYRVATVLERKLRR